MVKKKKTQVVDKHFLMPKHSIASEKEKQQVLKKYNATENEMPKIRMNDSGILHLTTNEGDLIKIERDDEWTGKQIFYRVVVNE